MIDTHCHLADEVFEPDLDAVITRARAAGLSSAICILAAGDGAEAARARRVRQLWPEAGFAVGVHPHQAHQCAGPLAEPTPGSAIGVSGGRMCAVGEIGLDYHYDFSPRDVQQAVFVEQLALRAGVATACRHSHARGRRGHICGVEGRRRGRGAACFIASPGASTARDARWTSGFHLSLAGIVTFPKATDLHEVAAFVPSIAC